MVLYFIFCTLAWNFFYQVGVSSANSNPGAGEHNGHFLEINARKTGRDTMQVATRPWCERSPPGYPLPLYARVEGSGGRSDEQRRPRRARGRGATAMRVV